MKSNKNIVLLGMMGSGKSTIGYLLSNKINSDFYDIDKIIEEEEGLKITEIFENKGENYFRKIEKKITLKELKKDNLVIALGGGAFINSSIRREIKNSCLSFWLDLNISSILLRLKNVKKRPLLDENKLEESINEIYSERKKFYNESNFRIKCNSKNKEETIHKIIKLYEGSRNQI